MSHNYAVVHDSTGKTYETWAEASADYESLIELGRYKKVRIDINVEQNGEQGGPWLVIEEWSRFFTEPTQDGGDK